MFNFRYSKNGKCGVRDVYIVEANMTPSEWRDFKFYDESLKILTRAMARHKGVFLTCDQFGHPRRPVVEWHNDDGRECQVSLDRSELKRQHPDWYADEINGGSGKMRTEEESPLSVNHIRFRDAMADGHWENDYRPALGDNSFPLNYDECVTSPDKTVNSAPEEAFAVVKVRKIAKVTKARRFTGIRPAPLGQNGFDLFAKEDGVEKKVEVKHRFYSLSYFYDVKTGKDLNVPYVEEGKMAIMERNGTDYIFNLFQTDDPLVVDWAYWDVSEYFRTGRMSERRETTEFNEENISLLPENGYWVSQAIDVGGQFDGREV